MLKYQFLANGLKNYIEIPKNSKINEDIYVDVLFINDSLDLSGNINCGKAIINGSNHIKGNLKAGVVSINGEIEIIGSVEADNIALDGTLFSNLNISCEILSIIGEMGCCNVSSKNINIIGKVNVRGVMTGEYIKIFSNDCVINKITCDTIKIKGGILEGNNIKIKIEEIEGNIVCLENVDVSFVKANQLIFNSECTIGNIEAKEIIRK